MKPSVYVETTIISYLTSRPSRDLVAAAHQQITADWWENVRSQVECYISPFVIQEVSRGDEEMVKRRLEVTQDMSVLALNDDVQKLAEEYVAAIKLPEKAALDAFHLAVAAWYRVDYVLSWNCKHIASGRVQKLLQGVNGELNIHTPILCTPEELMEV